MRLHARAIVIRGEQLLVIKRNKQGDKFFTLPGGKVDDNETTDIAAVREVREEASIECTVDREVYHEEVEDFGETSYFLCDYVTGEPKLDPDSEEAKDTAKGENLYMPMWLEIRALPEIRMLPTVVAKQLENDLDIGFGTNVLTLKSEKESL